VGIKKQIKDWQSLLTRGKTMKIVVLGTRGFPGVQGGVEVHCEKLYPRIAKLGCEVMVLTRKPYVNPQIRLYKGVKLVHVGCPKRKSLEAIVHSFKGVLVARKLNPDLLHVHAVGPSLVIPLARTLGMKVIMTNHGPDYQRKKWGAIAKLALKTGEKWGSRWANKIICISKNIADNIRSNYRRDSDIIPNGIEIPEISESHQTLKKYSLERGKYILSVGRFVPEKGFDDLIDAFARSELNGWRLVIVGRADHEDKYSKDLIEKSCGYSNIILTGFLSGQSLQELYSHAGLFVLPSYYEGLPIVLLEAMSYGLLCLASNIPANRCVDLPDENYFYPGDIERLSIKLREFSRRSLSEAKRSIQINMLRQKYNWDNIALETMGIYKKAIHNS
jgi:glycosyltransferase involved in cell wall biosynthesis